MPIPGDRLRETVVELVSRPGHENVCASVRDLRDESDHNDAEVPAT